MLRPNEILIDDSSPLAPLLSPVVDSRPKGRGHDPSQVIRGMYSPPSDLQLIPRSEWSDRIKEKIATKSQLSDIRLAGNHGQPIPSLDQGQVGYCWAHSTTHTVIVQRAVAHEPYVPLSAYAIAATIKKGADEGGWCGLSAQFAREKGIPSQALWPQGDRGYAKYQSNPAVWADAAERKITEDYVDLARDVYDQNLTFDQVATCLLLNIPCAVDFNWWSHSVCALDLVETSPGSFGLRIWNSWGDSWSDRGMGVLSGSKAIPDGALATRVTGAG